MAVPRGPALGAFALILCVAVGISDGQEVLAAATTAAGGTTAAGAAVCLARSIGYTRMFIVRAVTLAAVKVALAARCRLPFVPRAEHRSPSIAACLSRSLRERPSARCAAGGASICCSCCGGGGDGGPCDSDAVYAS